MIYIISLVIITILSIYFDFYCNGKSNKASIFYNLLLIWFISVSGFAYNVGSDIPAYMDEYDGFCQFFSFYSLSDIFTFENRQPAWVLLNIICGAISDNFLTLKLIIASFVNSCIFYFIKRRTRYYFLGILFYSVFLYLNLNFNALRQSVSIAFFLLAYLDFADRKYGRYCAWAICAFLFHVSGIISFILPLLKYVRVNSKSLFLYGTILVLLLLVALRTGILQDALTTFLTTGIEFSGENISNLGNRYADVNGDLVNALNLNGVIVSFFNMCIIIGVIFYNRNINPYDSSVCVGYLVLFVLNFTVPVVFYRFMFYLQIVYICTLSTFSIEFPKLFKNLRTAVLMLLLLVFLYSPFKSLFSVNISSGIMLIDQFCPYYSVFNPQLDHQRLYYFGAHE